MILSLSNTNSLKQVSIYIDINDWFDREAFGTEFLAVKVCSNPVVLNLGSIEPQWFGESVSGVRRLRDFQQ